MKVLSYKSVIKYIEDYLKKSPWSERFQENRDFYFSELSNQLNISEDELFERVKDQPASGNMYGIIFESLFDKEYGDSHINIIDEYIKRRGWKLSKEEKAILEQLRDQPFSIYEVIEVNQGDNVVIQNILVNSGEIRVFEKSGSKSMKPFDFIVAKVLKEDETYGFTGCIFKISKTEAKRIQNKVKEAFQSKNIILKDNEDISDETNQEIKEILRAFTSEMLISAFKYALTPTRYITYEGDDIAPAEITFIVKDRKRVINKLNKHNDLYIADEEPDNLFWNWAVDKKTLAVAERNASTFETFLDNDLLVIGNIELVGKILKCSTMSEPRTKKLIKLLQDYLGDLIDMPVVKHIDIFKKSKKKKSEKVKPEVPIEIEREIVTEYFDEHYRKILDEKISVLNNQTPRECAKTDPERVKRWLKMLDEQETTKKINYDTSWIWKELGIKK